MANLKKNFFFSALLTLANYIFPLITYPYVSRVLGVTNIGICNFVDSIINYFLVFSTMGISVLGVREIAAAREDRKERSRVFSNLLFLNAFTGPRIGNCCWSVWLNCWPTVCSWIGFTVGLKSLDISLTAPS